MIHSPEYVLRAIELRIKTKPIIGTLCSIEDPSLIWNAMKYFQCYNHGNYVSHPFAELDDSIFENMDVDLFRVYAELNNLYGPPCTNGEIRSTIYHGKKLGYHVTQNKNYISIRRVKHDRTIDRP